jgi:hypothetical protein
MSLDVYLEAIRPTTVYSDNITHNLGKMANAAGVYQHLWRPEELGITLAIELIAPLAAGLSALKNDPDKFKALNPDNGWGNYDGLVKFIEDYILACVENADATIRVSR